MIFVSVSSSCAHSRASSSFAATRTSNFTSRVYHRRHHRHRHHRVVQNVRLSSGGGDDDEHHHHHHHAPSSSSLVVNRRAVVLERPAKIAVLSFLLLSSSSSPNNAFAKGGKSLEEKERAKDARKRALRAAAERAKETGVGGAAFSDSEYMVGEDHSPNQHSHQEEGSKGSFV